MSQGSSVLRLNCWTCTSSGINRRPAREGQAPGDDTTHKQVYKLDHLGCALHFIQHTTLYISSITQEITFRFRFLISSIKQVEQVGGIQKGTEILQIIFNLFFFSI